MRISAAGKLKVLYKLRIPNSVPYIFIALKVAVPSCVISALVSEYFAEYIVGVGRKIRENIFLHFGVHIGKETIFKKVEK